MLTIVKQISSIIPVLVCWLITVRLVLSAITFIRHPYDDTEYFYRFYGAGLLVLISSMLTWSLVVCSRTGNELYFPWVFFSSFVLALLLFSVAYLCDSTVQKEFDSEEVTGVMLTLGKRIFVKDGSVKRSMADRILGTKYLLSGIKVRHTEINDSEGRVIPVALVIRATEKTGNFPDSAYSINNHFSELVRILRHTKKSEREIEDALHHFQAKFSFFDTIEVEVKLRQSSAEIHKVECWN